MDKLRVLAWVSVLGSTASILSAFSLFLVPPLLVHVLGVLVIAIGTVSVLIFGFIMLVQRERALRAREIERTRAEQAEQLRREAETDSRAEIDNLTLRIETLGEKHARQRSDLQFAIRELRVVSQECCQLVSQLDASAEQAHIAVAAQRVDRFVQDSVDRLKSVYEGLWGESKRCRVCIKYLRPAGKIQVMFRDLRSGRVDQDTEPQYRIDQYTSLADIYGGRREFFYGEDLVSMARTSNYKNPENNWQNRYQTNLVVPIAKPPSDDAIGRDIIGFLSISCSEPHTMVLERDLEIALTGASHLFVVLAALDACRKAAENRATESERDAPRVRRTESRSGG